MLTGPVAGVLPKPNLGTERGICPKDENMLGEDFDDEWSAERQYSRIKDKKVKMENGDYEMVEPVVPLFVDVCL
jgi:hypothetical protein